MSRGTTEDRSGAGPLCGRVALFLKVTQHQSLLTKARGAKIKYPQFGFSPLCLYLFAQLLSKDIVSVQKRKGYFSKKACDFLLPVLTLFGIIRQELNRPKKHLTVKKPLFQRQKFQRKLRHCSCCQDNLPQPPPPPKKNEKNWNALKNFSQFSL